MKERTEYVLGFLFSEDRKQVALILKNKPEWQKDHFNGIGGKIKSGEAPEEAMIREFNEETGVLYNDWIKYALMFNDDFACYCYKGFSDTIFQTRSAEEETVSIMNVSDIQYKYCISNLNWLIAAALDEAGGNYAVKLWIGAE